MTNSSIGKILLLLVCYLSLTTAAGAGLDVGTPAPDFTLPTAAGGTITLSQLHGQVVILHFWKSD